MPARNAVSLFAELERVLDSKNMLLVAIKHGQVKVDGYTVKLSDDRRWDKHQLAGRRVVCNQRVGILFGSTRSTRQEPTQVRS